MKIALYTSWNMTCGIADYSGYLVRALEHNRVSVEIVPVTDDKSTGHFIDDCRKLNRADVAHIQYEYTFSSNCRIPFVPSLKSLWHMFLFSRLIHNPKFITVHELGSWEDGNPFLRFLGSLFLKAFAKILGRFERTIVHTDRFRTMLIRSGMDERRVLYIPHPIPVSTPPAVAVREEAREFKRSLMAQDAALLTIFGFVNARKGYDLALSAIAEMQNCFLLIAGGPQPGDTSGYFEKLLRDISALNLQGKVKALGFISEAELERVMLATDIFLAPFIDAAASGSLSRVMANLKPIVASDIPGMRELKELGAGIVLFKSGDCVDLTNTVRRLLDDKEEQRHVIELTAAFIDRRSYDSFARDLKSLYGRTIRK